MLTIWLSDYLEVSKTDRIWRWRWSTEAKPDDCEISSDREQWTHSLVQRQGGATRRTRTRGVERSTSTTSSLHSYLRVLPSAFPPWPSNTVRCPAKSISVGEIVCSVIYTLCQPQQEERPSQQLADRYAKPGNGNCNCNCCNCCWRPTTTQRDHGDAEEQKGKNGDYKKWLLIWNFIITREQEVTDFKKYYHWLCRGSPTPGCAAQWPQSRERFRIEKTTRWQCLSEWVRIQKKGYKLSSVDFIRILVQVWET